jgi:hypothetical protein
VAVIAAATVVVWLPASTQADTDRGGTYRVGWEATFDWGTDDFDPTGEDDPRSFGIVSNLLLRTLVGYNHVAGAAGRRLVPDLAVRVPGATNAAGDTRSSSSAASGSGRRSTARSPRATSDMPSSGWRGRRTARNTPTSTP